MLLYVPLWIDGKIDSLAWNRKYSNLAKIKGQFRAERRLLGLENINAHGIIMYFKRRNTNGLFEDKVVIGLKLQKEKNTFVKIYLEMALKYLKLF